MDQSENQNVPKFAQEGKKYNSLEEDREMHSMAQGAQGS
jgi:hypothetical protein